MKTQARLYIVGCLLLVVIGGIAVALSPEDQKCSLPERKGELAGHPECLFYSGTQRFREEDYVVAGEYWQRLIDLKAVPTEFEHLQTSAYNNLGFLYYNGMGRFQDHSQAITHWKHAYDRGHPESAYHLCHTYAEAKQPEFDLQRARGYCIEALRRYKELNTSETEIVSQLNQYIDRLSEK